MEDFSVDELKQLINFYRQKASELELQNLQLQIKLNNLMLKQPKKKSE